MTIALHPKKRAQAAQQFLAEISALLAASFDDAAMLKQVAELAVPILADWCAVFLVVADAPARLVAAAHHVPAKRALASELNRRNPCEPGGDDPVSRAVWLGETTLIPEMADAVLAATAWDTKHLALLCELGVRASIVVPLIVQGRPAGALWLGAGESGRRYTAVDLALAEEVARRTALALDRARLYHAAQAARTEAEVQHDRLERLFTQAPACIAITRGPTHVYDLVNDQYQQIMGPRQLLGRSVRNALPELTGQGLFELLDQLYATGERFVGTELSLQWDQQGTGHLERRWFDVVYQPIRDAAGGAEGIMVYAVDVTQRVLARQKVERLNAELEQLVVDRTAALAALRESQAQLVQSGKLAAIGTLAAGVAHELNQPLTVIRGQTQLLLAKGNDPESRSAKLARIEQQTEKMAAIIDHLLAFGHTSNGSTGQAVDLNTVVRDALLLIGAQAQEQGIVVRLDLAEAAPSVISDANQIEQIVLNLLVNARDALGHAGELVVRTWQDAAGGHLSVADSGPGIPADILARLFEPFFTTKPVGQGTGLGLPISRDIAQRWGGTLILENQTDAPGAIAHLTLPAASAPSFGHASELAAGQEREPGRREKSP